MIDQQHACSLTVTVTVTAVSRGGRGVHVTPLPPQDVDLLAFGGCRRDTLLKTKTNPSMTQQRHKRGNDKQEERRVSNIAPPAEEEKEKRRRRE